MKKGYTKTKEFKEQHKKYGRLPFSQVDKIMNSELLSGNMRGGMSEDYHAYRTSQWLKQQNKNKKSRGSK